jgi:ADP-ribose pyrophosphatase YjhB (NUDIX family)
MVIRWGDLMIFRSVFEEESVKGFTGKKNVREAVRAVIFKDNEILLVHTNKGDYKFPGGGIESGESYVEGLTREVAEETGYANCRVLEKLGMVTEKSIDTFEPDAIFNMVSHYYLCQLTNQKKIEQELDTYEYEQNFTPKWVTLKNAIHQNEYVLSQSDPNDWVTRETFVLKELQKIYQDKK